MNVFRVTNPQAVDLIRDQLLNDDGVSRAQTQMELKAFMESNPADLLFLLATEEENHKVEVRAFVIAWIPMGRDYLFLHQAFVEPKFSEKYPHVSRSLFSRVVAFAEGNGLRSVRAETTRSPEAFMRKYGFETFSTNLEFVLEQETI
ncbi:MAG: hypothetical protein Unbinned400contig1000_29 [Prokaryotic dsDNA virus sp.]|nr:MAG: hypothetical protein Unbinned400contig1000_29 [Prokaryotic dsDNA virus sp.]|tara:strand:+ start:1770 stop:2210 length:441 start_codon:yes stop_codon:yes gene_type:complete